MLQSVLHAAERKLRFTSTISPLLFSERAILPSALASLQHQRTMGDSRAASESTPLLPKDLKRGTYVCAQPGAKRSPCPLVNSLANHGYIPRDGKNVRADELNKAMGDVGLSLALGTIFARPIFNEHQDPNATTALRKRPGLLARIWSFIRNPWVMFAMFGMRQRDQLDTNGRKVLNLDQLALPGVVEHDVSLTRRDHQQKAGNLAKQADLVKELLASSQDGKVMTLEDFAAYRKPRIQQQLDDNPGLQYGSLQHQVGCTEIALILDVFGNGKSIPLSYAKAIFHEERLPVKEGWRKRFWWPLGFLELGRTVNKVKAAIGLQL